MRQQGRVLSTCCYSDAGEEDVARAVSVSSSRECTGAIRDTSRMKKARIVAALASLSPCSGTWNG